MNAGFDECLRKRRIWEFSRGKTLAPKELGTAARDLEEATASLERASHKWATVQSYYSMFHTARALLYARNYREKSHYCLIAAIRALYVETGKLPVKLVEALHRAKELREEADYRDEWSETAATSLYVSAREFLDIAKGLLA